MTRSSLVHKQVRRLLSAVSRGQFTSSVAFQLSRSGLLPSAIWRRLPVHGSFRVDVGNGRAFQYASDDGFGRALFWKGMNGWYDARQLIDFCRLASRSRRFIDVGANTGVYSLLACLMNNDCHVIAFEPVPRLHEHISTNVSINGWVNRCTIHQQAVSDFLGMARFHVPLTDMPSSASLHEGGFRGYEGESIEVEVTTVDESCFTGDRIDLMKIDVEGFEDRVLNGMPKVLARDKPDIVIECLPDGPYQQVEAILSAVGYQFYHMGPGGPTRMASIQPDPEEHYRDYLCSVDPHIEGLFT